MTELELIHLGEIAELEKEVAWLRERIATLQTKLSYEHKQKRAAVDLATILRGHLGEARALAREYLQSLREEDSEEVRQAARDKEAEFHPWLQQETE